MAGTLVLALVVSAPAKAQTKETFAVVATDRSLGGKTALAERLVRAWAKGSPRISFLDAARKARGDGAVAWNKKGEAALVSYKAGLDAYDSMDYDAALARLAASIEGFEQSDLTLYLDGLLDAYAARSLALFYAGRVPEARNQLVDLYTLRPDYTFDKSRLTPDIESHVEDARHSAESAPPTTLEIQVTPVVGRVFVDGRFMGVSPLEVPKLSPGNHIVSVLATGYAFAQGKQLASAGQIARFKLKLAPEGKALLGRLEQIRGVFNREDGLPDAVASLAKYAGAQEATVVVLEPSDAGFPKISALRIAADGHYLSRVNDSFSLERRGAAAKMDALLDRLHSTSRPRGPNGEAIKSLETKGNFFSSLPVAIYPGAAGVLGIIGGVAMGVSAKAKERVAHATPQLDDAGYRASMKQARSRALVADIFYGLGAAGLGVGAWLFFKDNPGGGASPNGAAQRDAFSMSAMPIPGGAAVFLQGTF